jgi:DNA end-binding protein Ku
MAARAIWKGELKIGATRVAVELYSAVKDQTVRFHILEQRTKTRVKQHMVNPSTGKEVPKEEIQKGYEIEPGIFVIVTDEEMEAVEPKSSREIEITHFIPVTHINPQWYERPYYLAPDGDAKAYFALAEALAGQKKAAMARWVMRKKEYVGALLAQGDHLVLITLRHAEEVLSAEDLPAPRGRALDKKELNMAKQLVEMLDGTFDPSDFKDEYRERALNFIKKKARHKTPRLKAVRSKRATTALGNALEKSIQSLKKEKTAA